MNTSVFHDVQTGIVRTSPSDLFGSETRATSLVRHSSALHRDAVMRVEDTGILRRQYLLNALEEKAQEVLRTGGLAMLGELRACGFSWRDIARTVGVSVPAVQKWRRGERVANKNLLELAKFAALLRLLSEIYIISDPASWLLFPVKDGVHLSKLDLLIAGRFDLVLELASDQIQPSDAGRILDEFDKAWREKFVDDSFEVVLGADGIPAIRPKV